MPLFARPIVLGLLVGIFLIGDVGVAALLWRARSMDLLIFAAAGALVAQPMLLALWLGLARQSIVRRLTATLGLSVVGALSYSGGTVLSGDKIGWDAYLLFLIAGVGATVLGGGFFRAHRFLMGVLATDAQSSQLEDVSQEGSRDDSPSSHEMQFGVGYILAMTGAVAILVSLLRWLASFTQAQWPVVMLFGWTFLVYAVLAALVTAVSVLKPIPRRISSLLAISYTLLAPLLALWVIEVGDKRAIGPAQVVNLYAFTLSLTATLALVACILRSLGYRLRGGWL